MVEPSGDTVPTGHGQPEPRAGRAGESDRHSGSILIVEDDKDLQVLFARALRQAGYSVEVVPDSLAAYSAILRSLPDLLVLDVGLPDSSGLDLCRNIRASAPVVMPIVVVTAHSHLSGDAEAAGATRYLMKPLSLETLVDEVRALL
ncbi:response regulator transcription factor [Longispora urticae]